MKSAYITYKCKPIKFDINHKLTQEEIIKGTLNDKFSFDEMIRNFRMKM